MRVPLSLNGTETVTDPVGGRQDPFLKADAHTHRPGIPTTGVFTPALATPASLTTLSTDGASAHKARAQPRSSAAHCTPASSRVSRALVFVRLSTNTAWSDRCLAPDRSSLTSSGTRSRSLSSRQRRVRQPSSLWKGDGRSVTLGSALKAWLGLSALSAVLSGAQRKVA